METEWAARLLGAGETQADALARAMPSGSWRPAGPNVMCPGGAAPARLNGWATARSCGLRSRVR